MTYDDAIRALDLTDEEQYPRPFTADTIKSAFRRAAKKAHPDTRTEDGGPTLAQVKEAYALLMHMVSVDCPTCRGLTYVKTFGTTHQCPTCRGTGRVTP